MIFSKFFRHFFFCLITVTSLFLTISSYKLQIDKVIRRFVFHFNSLLASMGEFEHGCRRQNSATKARAISVPFDICEHRRGTELDADTRGKELLCHG